MKRICLTLFVAIFTITISAENTDKHLKQLVQCINDSDFVCAAEQLPLVENWEYDNPSDTIEPNLDFGILFIKYLNRQNTTTPLFDSLQNFLTTEWYNVGDAYCMNGKYTKAKPYFQNIIELKENEHIVDDIYAYALGDISWVYCEIGKFNEGEKYEKLSLEVKKGLFGELSEQYSTSLNNLGLIYHQTNRDEKAIEFYNLSLNLQNQRNTNYAITLENIGVSHAELGQFQEAEQYLLQAAEIVRKEEGELSLYYANVLNNIGWMYMNMHDYSKAETNYQSALDIRTKILGEDHPTTIISIRNLALLYTSAGVLEKGQQYYNKVKTLIEKNWGKQHIEYFRTLEHLGCLEKSKGYLPTAESYLLEAKEGFLSLYPNMFDDLNGAYNNLGIVYNDMKLYRKAEQNYLESLRIYETHYGNKHYRYSTLLNNIGITYIHLDEPENAISYCQKASNEGKKRFVKSVDYMSYRQREAFEGTQEKIRTNIYPVLTLKYCKVKPNISTFAFDNELFTKGLLLTSSNAVKNSVLESGDTTLIRQWNDLTNKKQQIMALEEKNPQMAYLAELREEAERLEKEITRKSAAFRENMRQWNITWDSVKAALKPNQVAIEYMRAPLNEDSTMYCALLVRDTCSYPIMIPLFEEKEVSALLHQSTANKDSINTTYAYDKNGKQLSQHIWSNVKPYINEGEVVFFAPTGILHQIAIENLPLDETSTIGDKYNIVRLSSTRELAINRPTIPHQTATLYGGIFYEPMDSIMLIANATKYRSMETTESNTFANDTTRRSVAKYLPGSKAEIDSIQPILKKKHIAVTVYSKDTACEESFKAQSGKQPNILLLSTHGFFWQDSTAKKERYFSQRGMLLGDGNDVSKFSATIDPLERCGLLFSGANTALSGHSERLPKGVDDGILTAKEISALDFRSTDIVVMSACETGLGDISGEGVFGLQRAFKMAGAKTIMMTLWQVNDRATNLFMTSFFRHYSQGMSKRQAFRMAQQEVRNYTAEGTSSGSRSSLHEKYKSKGKMTGQAPKPPKGGVESSVGANPHPYASPYYWAGFILLD